MFEVIQKVVRIRNYTLILAAIFIFVISSLIIHLIEPETFPTLFIGFWWVMTTVTTVGFGDYAPVTVAGRIFGIILYLVGIAIVGVLIGKIVDSFSTYHKLKEEGRLSYNGKDHFIVVGWSSKAKKTTQELLIAKEHSDIVIIDKQSTSPYIHARVHYIQGDPTTPDTLKKANILQATSVCIFAAEPINDAIEADGKTLLIASAIENYASENNHPIYTIAEILKEKHIPNFKHANVDEFIVSNEVFSELMAQSAIYNGSTRLFMQLLTRHRGDDIWEIPKRPDWVIYDDAFTALKTQGANLIADHEDLSIIRRLNDRIPVDAKLYIICDEKTYKKVIS
ncbi:potassium channel family protein [Bacillus suaedae]|uniref:NAD-binding protein n=1 Tax=Halalkalibacter suaedae TaxID=2822140 RepID=A0A940WPA2_9BACI|nr:potassium channel family protein [Bacillus suaedae]MBP3949861.1 NAD-binding protein [Bacillus suaedae]